MVETSLVVMAVCGAVFILGANQALHKVPTVSMLTPHYNLGGVKKWYQANLDIFWPHMTHLYTLCLMLFVFWFPRYADLSSQRVASLGMRLAQVVGLGEND